MSLLGPDNAIGWAQLQLKGGVRGALSSAATWGSVMAVGVTAWAWIAGTAQPGSLFGITMALLAWQGMLLILLGSGRVGGAIRRDLDGGMIESHRLMPTPPAEAVFGYLFGSTAQTLALAFVTFLVGMATASAAGVSPMRWIVPNLLLLETAVFVWVLIAAASFVAKGVAVVAAFLALPLFNAGLAGLVPALAALFNPLIGGGVFDMRTRSAELGWTHAAAMMAQVAVAAHFFAAACRKYRRSDALAMGPWLTLSLLATWVGISAMAMAAWEDFRPTLMRQGDVDPRIRFVASLVGSLILAIATVWTAAAADADWRRRRRAGAAVVGRRPPAVAAVALVATIVLLLLNATAPPLPEPDRLDAPLPTFAPTVARSGVAIFTALLGMGYLHRIVLRGGGKSKVVPGIWFTLVWLVPIAVDLILIVLDVNPRGGSRERDTLGFASTFSPIGALGILWTVAEVDPTTGIAAQAALALVPVALFHLTDRAERRSRSGPASAGPNGPPVPSLEMDTRPSVPPG